MDDRHFDIAILGTGPIGAASAFCLSQRPDLRVGVITQDPTEDVSATYLYAGGSIRLGWEDPVKDQATSHTASLIRQLIDDGADVNLVDNGYVFVNRGYAVPSLNVAGAKVIAALLERARHRGVRQVEGARVDRLVPASDGYRIETTQGEFQATRVVAALGVANRQFVPRLSLEVEKRQLFVLDAPVDGHRLRMPHLVMPFHEGVIFVFVKKFAYGYRLVLGQEDVVEHFEEPGPEPYFDQLIELGLTKTLPFLEGVGVERTLWGYDARNKVPRIETEDGRLFTVNCGSALRSAAAIGDQVAAHLLS